MFNYGFGVHGTGGYMGRRRSDFIVLALASMLGVDVVVVVRRTQREREGTCVFINFDPIRIIDKAYGIRNTGPGPTTAAARTAIVCRRLHVDNVHVVRACAGAQAR